MSLGSGRHCCDVDWLSHVEGGATASDHTELVVRVRDVAVEGMLSAEIYTDLVGLDEGEARSRLLGEFERRRGRVKPERPPRFPAVHGGPRFPGRGVRFGIPHQAAFFVGREGEL